MPRYRLKPSTEYTVQDLIGDGDPIVAPGPTIAVGLARLGWADTMRPFGIRDDGGAVIAIVWGGELFVRSDENAEQVP